MKKLILMLSMVFSLFMSMSVFAAGDYSIGGASWDTGDRALATWDEAEDKTKYKVQLYKGNKKIGSNNSTSAAKYDFTKLISDNGVGNYSFKVYPLKGGPDMTIESESEYFDSDVVAGFKKSRSSNTSNNSDNTSISTDNHDATHNDSNSSNSSNTSHNNSNVGITSTLGHNDSNNKQTSPTVQNNQSNKVTPLNSSVTSNINNSKSGKHLAKTGLSNNNLASLAAIGLVLSGVLIFGRRKNRK